MHHARLASLSLTVFILACSGLFSPSEPEAPEPAVAEPEPVAQPEPQPAPEAELLPMPERVAGDETVDWPLRRMARVPDGASAGIPAGQVFVDLDIAPHGEHAIVVTRDGEGGAHWLRWDFEGAPTPMAAPYDEARDILEIGFSELDGSLYVLGKGDGHWFIDRCLSDGDGIEVVHTAYLSALPLSDLVVPFLRYDGRERVYFAAEDPGGGHRVLTVTRGAQRAYEVTSPTGELTSLTDPGIRAIEPQEWGEQPPSVLAAGDAVPMGLHPATGALFWRDGDGGIHRRAYADTNWGEDEKIAVAETWLAPSPNGWLEIGWTQGHSLNLYSPQGDKLGSVPIRFSAPPAVAANGRAVVGHTAQGLVSAAVGHPLAPVRYLRHAGYDADTVAGLLENGLHVEPSGDQQVYNFYEYLLYEYDGTSPPVFASIDGVLEVLHAGFQAVFMRLERDAAKPRLDTLLGRLKTVAEGEGMEEIAGLADASQRMLAGDYEHPEGQLVLAEAAAESPLHGRSIDYQDFKPRGPYDRDDEARNYFRAFKSVNALRLKEEERAALAEDAELVEAWRAWVGVQEAFLQGSRQQGIFEEDNILPPWTSETCLPKKNKKDPFRVFPLNWGLDSEILDRTTAHDALPAQCGVPRRGLPNGLDLLVGIGSDPAQALVSSSYEDFPGLQAMHETLRQQWKGSVPDDDVVMGWLRLVQLLTTDAYVPEGVEDSLWRRRLMETALASWTSLRHTMVLVNESGVAEAGDGEGPFFEQLSLEPVRHVVDPVPESWAYLAGLFERLASEAQKGETTDRLAEILLESAENARDFGDMARRQRQGEPLTQEEYDRILRFARVVEHPFLLLQAAAQERGGEVIRPDPVAKIVDIYLWNDPAGPTQYWHAAVGEPQQLTVLIGDRGLLVPGRGSIYSYYEVVAEQRLNDEDWRKRVKTAERLDWVVASVQDR